MCVQKVLTFNFEPNLIILEAKVEQKEPNNAKKWELLVL